MEREYDPPLDPGIALVVKILMKNGVETFESCQGGNEHTFPEPTVRFHGGRVEGFRAVAVAVMNGLPLVDLRRVWRMTDSELTGPQWELTFAPVLLKRELAGSALD